jgi:hypothetical protein
LGYYLFFRTGAGEVLQLHQLRSDTKYCSFYIAVAGTLAEILPVTFSQALGDLGKNFSEQTKEFPTNDELCSSNKRIIVVILSYLFYSQKSVGVVGITRYIR